MKKFLAEFKAFISRGNVIDMAVGVIVGASFKAIVDSLVNDIINPILGIFGGKDFSEFMIPLPGGGTIKIGSFINAVINFLIMSLIIFCIIKFMNMFHDKFSRKKPDVPAPTTKICPYCKSEIPIDATKCPHCTSDVE